MAIRIRKSNERGYFDHGWLKTFHTFSFGNYHDQNYVKFRSLRVINEDRVIPGVGFPVHSHKDMEMISIVLKGSLAYQDDIGNDSILSPEDIQLVSAGSGISNCEINASDKDDVHFLKIWIIPSSKGLKPSFQKSFFPDSSKNNKLCLIASKDGKENSLIIHQDVEVYLSYLEKDYSLNRELAEGRHGWIQVIAGSIALNEIVLEEGDGAAISELSQIDIKALTPSKTLYIDLN
ncbi:MAG: pirin family protein [Parachlamydiaceae bacterium]|nr:pirin family protein [Parachlamydiaceae bacterium]